MSRTVRARNMVADEEPKVARIGRNSAVRGGLETIAVKTSGERESDRAEWSAFPVTYRERLNHLRDGAMNAGRLYPSVGS